MQWSIVARASAETWINNSDRGNAGGPHLRRIIARRWPFSKEMADIRNSVYLPLHILVARRRRRYTNAFEVRRYSVRSLTFGGIPVARAASRGTGRAKVGLLANIGHEIRTPLTAIINMSRLALKPGCTAVYMLQAAIVAGVTRWEYCRYAVSVPK